MANLVKARDAVGRMKLADIEAAYFIPAASDGSLDFEPRIGVSLPATKGADIVGSGKRQLSQAGRRGEEKQWREKKVAQSPAPAQFPHRATGQRATGHEVHTLASDDHASFVPRTAVRARGRAR